MKRIWRKTTLLVIFLILTGLATSGWWLTMTSGGARWLIQTVGTMGSTKLSTESVTGCLAKELFLSGLKLKWDNESLAIERLDLRWSLWSLLRGKVDIEELAVYGIRLALSEEKIARPEKAPEEKGSDMKPLASYLPRWVIAEVNQLHLEDFRVTKGTEIIFFFQDLTLSLSIHDHTLILYQFSWHSPYVHLDGKANLQMETMVLEMETEVLLPEELVKHDLLASIAVPPAFSGRLKAQGNIFNYQGEVTVGNLENQGFQLSSKASGSLGGLRLEKLYGHWLKGTLQGDLLLDWKKGFLMKGELFSRGLDPSALNSDWPGQINVDIKGGLETSDQKPLRAELAATLYPSLLLSRQVAGTAEGSWGENGLIVKDLYLEGEKLLIKARGPLAKRLDFQLDVENLGHWLPESRGKLQAGGWLRWHDHYLTVDARGEGTDLSFRGINAPQAEFSARHVLQEGPVEAHLSARRISYNDLVFKAGEISAKGTTESHVVDLSLAAASGKAGLQGNIDGSYRGGTWQGTLQKLVGYEQSLGRWTLVDPVDISYGNEDWAFSPLILQGEQGGVVRLVGENQAKMAEGHLDATWDELNLSRLGPWLPAGNPWGQSKGDVAVRWKQGKLDFLEGHLKSIGGITFEDKKIHVPRMAVDATWEQKGLNATILVDLGEKGKLNIISSSEDPIHFGAPRNSLLKMELQSFDLDVIRSFFPDHFPLTGNLSANGQGQWLGNRRFSWQGQASVQEGSLGWKSSEPIKGQVVAKIGNAVVNWDWQRDFLHFDLAVTLEKSGNLSGEATFPFRAEWPVKIRENGPVQGKLKGNMHEWGLLTTLFPDLIRETRGKIETDLILSGTWQNPLLNGKLALKNIGGYLPPTGVQLDDGAFSAEFQGREARITEFHIRSGPGTLDGKGLLYFPHAGGINYRLELTGKQFQLANLPEVQILGEPNLLIQGSARKFSLRGDILFSDLLISGTQKTPDVRASRDVVIIRPVETDKEPSSDFDLDIRVKISLGKKALVKTSGLDAKLEGEVLILQKEAGKTLAEGQIRVADGSFQAFGSNLKVKRGHLNFTGGRAENPSLDILALREIGKVRAGVQVTGTAEYPEVTLYSIPAMPQKDIIGYMFLGRPMRTDEQGGDALALGAKALLPQGTGFFRSLGFTDIDLGGLFDEGGAVRIRYQLRENLEVESTLGETSGVDLYHVIEFE